MHTTVIGAYPDPKHYLRQNISRIVTHSNRVTAAVCLKQGGASNEEIAFRLQWKITSVPPYLRDCYQQVGVYLSQTIYGAMMST